MLTFDGALLLSGQKRSGPIPDTDFTKRQHEVSVWIFLKNDLKYQSHRYRYQYFIGVRRILLMLKYILDFLLSVFCLCPSDSLTLNRTQRSLSEYKHRTLIQILFSASQMQKQIIWKG